MLRDISYAVQSVGELETTVLLTGSPIISTNLQTSNKGIYVDLRISGENALV